MNVGIRYNPLLFFLKDKRADHPASISFTGGSLQMENTLLFLDLFKTSDMTL